MSDNDIKLLKLINSDGALLSISDYRQRDLAADTRLSTLEQRGLITKHLLKDIDYIGDYEITGKSYAFISDYDLGIRKARSARIRELLSNVYIPLLVSAIFNLIVAMAKG